MFIDPEKITKELDLDIKKNVDRFLMAGGGVHLDNTRLSDFTMCELKFYFRHVLGIIPNVIHMPPVFGIAIHAFLAEFYFRIMYHEAVKTSDTAAIQYIQERLKVSEKDMETRFKNLDAAWEEFYRECKQYQISPVADAKYSIPQGERIINDYIDAYGDLDPDIHPIAVECFFDDIEITTKEEEGEGSMPVLLAGRLDLIANIGPKREIAIVDHKTSSSLGAKHGDKYELNWQVDIYTFCTNIYLGILTGKFDESRCKTFYLNVLATTLQSKFGRFKLSRPRWMLERSMFWIKQWAYRVAKSVTESTYCPNFTNCTRWGLCEYHLLCTSPSESWYPLIQTNFQHHLWDPSELDD